MTILLVTSYKNFPSCLVFVVWYIITFTECTALHCIVHEHGETFTAENWKVPLWPILAIFVRHFVISHFVLLAIIRIMELRKYGQVTIWTAYYDVFLTVLSVTILNDGHRQKTQKYFWGLTDTSQESRVHYLLIKLGPAFSSLLSGRWNT